jgi:hypothetical protein
MDRERVECHQTVLVRDDRVVAIEPVATVLLPSNAKVIDRRGRFLLPGLGERAEDAVHLEAALDRARRAVRDMRRNHDDT